MRDFIGEGNFTIDGRLICYRLVTVCDYLRAKGMSDQELSDFQDKHSEVADKINQVMGLKQSCFLLRRVSESCGSLADDLYSLKNRLIRELKEQHDFDFDDDFVERNGEPEKHCRHCGKPMIVCYDKSVQHGNYHTYDMMTDADHMAEE